MSFLDNIFTFSSQMVDYLGTLAGTVADGRVAVDLHGTTLSGDISAIVTDETATGTLALLNDAVTVAMEGRPYAGFAVGAGFSGQLTFEASLDGGTRWRSVQTYSPSTLPPTISGATMTVSGSADERGIIVPIGATHVRARVSTPTSGTCTATIRATVAGVVNVLPQLDSITNALGSYLATLAGAITSSRMAVDLATAPTANLAALAGAVTSARMAVNVDSSTTGKLDSIITALGSYLSTLAGSVSASRVAVDLTTAVTTYLSNLPTLAGAITSSRMAVNVDSTTTGKLDTLHADLSPASAVYTGSKTVSSAGTPVALAASQALTKGVRVRAKDANTGLIYIGTSTGDRLSPGEPYWIDINNLATVMIDAAVSGEGVTYSGW